MIDFLVDARKGILRVGKNLFKGRFLKKSEYIDTKLPDILFPYQNTKIKVFGIDSYGRAHMYTADYKFVVEQANNIIEANGLEQVSMRHQQFSGIFLGKNNMIDYYDSKYDNGKGYRLKSIIKIG